SDGDRASGRRDGQRDRERGAAALLRIDPDPPAMLLDDVPGDRQSQPGPAATDPDAVDLVEALEDPGLICLRDADAVILDGPGHVRVARPDRHPDFVSRRIAGR